jgi:hypothetical protein
MGMDATIVVETASVANTGVAENETGGTAAGMPTTGSMIDWLVPAMLGGLLLAISGTAVRLRLRKGKRLA